jgi:hypothetical protein
MIEDFLHLPLVSTTPVVHHELRISLRIFEKIRNDPNSILRRLGETDEKTRSRKSRDSVPKGGAMIHARIAECLHL